MGGTSQAQGTHERAADMVSSLGSVTSSWDSSCSGKEVAVGLLCLTNQSSEYLLSTWEASQKSCLLPEPQMSSEEIGLNKF